jgi:protein subunit release factor A
VAGKWPFCFDVDDVEATYDGPTTVVLVHQPTGVSVLMSAYSSREANLQAAFRRLHSVLDGD